jgi:integrase
MRQRGVRDASVNVALNALRFAADAADVDLFDIGQLRLQGAKRAVGDAKPLALNEIRRLLKTCASNHPRDLRDRAIITLLARTGMLRFSLCALRITDFDPAAKTLHTMLKGGRRYTIKLDATTAEAVRAWYDWLAEYGVTIGRLFRGIERDVAGVPPVVGVELSTDAIYKILRLRGQQADVEVTPEALRATFRALATRAGASPRAIAAVTGYRFAAGAKISADELGACSEDVALPAW